MATNRTGSAEAARMSEYVGQLFSRAIRTALLKGLDAAVRATKHDSSQAAAHWMLAGSDGKNSRPWQRKMGKLQYIRGSGGRVPIAPAGYRGDHGANEEAAVKFVHQRELTEVITQLVSGRRPEFRFYFYNAAGGVDAYNARANIENAGNEAVRVVIEEATKQILVANTRKIPLS